MIELLELCGFESKDIEVELPRVERIFNKIGITAGDIEQAKQRLRRYYDVELKGVRRGLRASILELVDLMLAREEGKTKVFYGFMTSSRFETVSSALMAKSKEIYSARIDFMFQRVLGCIFGKMNHVFEAAEQNWVKAGRMVHCGNVKSVMGLFALDLIPKPDMMVTSGFLCETAPKSIDMLQELYGIPGYCYDACNDIEYREPAGANRRTIDLAVKGLRKFVERIQDEVGFEITDEMLREVLDAKSRMGNARRKLDEVIQGSDPPPITPHSEMISGSQPSKMENIDEAIEGIDILYEELKARVDSGVGVIEKGAPRILTAHGPHNTDPTLEYLLTELGIRVAGAAMGSPMDAVVDRSDPYVEMALMPGGNVCLAARIAATIDACKKMKVDGLLDLYHAGCRAFAGDAVLIKEAVEKEVGIPVLLMEWENFDPRIYNHEQYKRRLEVFKMMMLERKAASN